MAMNSQKKLRHPHESTSAPPISGPMFGANPIAMPAMPIAVPFCPLGKRVIAIDCRTGSVMPAPTACSTRPKTSTPNVGASASTMPPTRNNPNARKTTLRRERRCDKNVTAGTVMPSTSM